MKKIVLTLFAIVNLSYALNLQELKNMPKCRERDFFIWRFLQQKDTTKKEAFEVSKLIFRVNSKLNSAFYKKTGFKLKQKSFVYKENKYYKKLAIKLLKQKDIYSAWLNLSDKDKVNVFNYLGRERKLLNKPIDSKLYNRLTKYSAINSFIKRAKKENLNYILKTIYNTRPTSGNKISYENLMKLGFDTIKQNKKSASYFFYAARIKAKDRFSADRANFWIYLSTNRKKYLEYVAKTHDFNIYKLIALDKMNLPYPKPLTTVGKNKNHPPFDIKDPIFWARLKQKIFSNKYNLYELAKKFNYYEATGYYTYILNKASKDKKQYFPILYTDVLKNYSKDRAAMILAIARQESRFVPASISSSFAVGLMQFMPFLVKHIAKVRKESVKLEDMFDPRISIKFANTHLNYLNKWLYNPLFVAYAYNAGIGYTRRLIRKKNLFNSGEFEPYLSLELVGNTQANIYAKKVLANYVIYKMLLKDPVKISDILDELKHPHLTDRFRKNGLD